VHALPVNVSADGAADLRIDRRLGHRYTHVVPALPEQFEIAKEDALDLVEHGLLVRQLCLEVSDDVSCLALEDGEQQTTFAVEVAVNQPLGAAGPLGDLPRRGRVEAALRERLIGGVDQGGSAEQAVPRAWFGLQVEGDGWAPLACACARNNTIFAPSTFVKSFRGT
jgi:hypothetical protein